MKLGSNLGLMLLGIWLVLFGVDKLVNLNIQAMPTISGALAVAAGALILMNR